ncbi:hypothetical protein CsSME_00005567 [Camellia sinensis var. sinensis]
MTFYELVYGEMNDQVRDVVISMVDQEREGEEIDQALVKNVLDIYTEMGEGSMKYYQKDFDEAMLADTAAIYSPKASIWITSESYKDYMLKVTLPFCVIRQYIYIHIYIYIYIFLKLGIKSKLEEKKQLDSGAA